MKRIALAILLAIIFAQSSIAATRPAWLNKSLQSAHFEAWYTDDSINYPNDAITFSDAQRVLDYFEMARDIEVNQWGYPEPASAGNPLYEIWIQYFAPPQNGSCFDPAPGTPVNTSKIRINSKLADLSYGDLSLLLLIAGHEYHHASEQAYINFGGTAAEIMSRIWLLEFSSTWAGYNLRRLHPEIPGAGAWEYLRDRLNYFAAHSYNGLQYVANGGVDIRDYHDSVTFAYFLTENAIVPFAGADRWQGEIIKDFWQSMSGFGDWNHIPEAFDLALANAPDHYADFNNAFEIFALAVYFNSQAFPFGPDAVTSDRSFNSTDIESPDDSTLEIDFDSAIFPIDLASSSTAEPRSIGPMGSFYIHLHPGSLGHNINISFSGEPSTRFAVHYLSAHNNAGCHDERMILDPTNSGASKVRLNPADNETGVIAIIRLDESGTGTYEIQIEDLGTFAPQPTGYQCDLWATPAAPIVTAWTPLPTARKSDGHGGCAISQNISDLSITFLIFCFIAFSAYRRFFNPKSKIQNPK